MTVDIRRLAGLVSICGALALTGCASTPKAAPSPAPSAPTKPAADIVLPPITNPRAAPDPIALEQYRKWIDQARVKHPYKESGDRMYAVMMCESGGRAAIINPVGPYAGLFQYSTATWNDTWNTYRDGGVKDPKAQIFATALAWSLKMQSHWGCYKKTTSTP